MSVCEACIAIIKRNTEIPIGGGLQHIVLMCVIDLAWSVSEWWMGSLQVI